MSGLEIPNAKLWRECGVRRMRAAAALCERGPDACAIATSRPLFHPRLDFLRNVPRKRERGENANGARDDKRLGRVKPKRQSRNNSGPSKCGADEDMNGARKKERLSRHRMGYGKSF
jgi:hypothetical protein